MNYFSNDKIIILHSDPLGRKRAMILVNIPFAIGWLVLHQTTAVWHIYFAFAMLGLGIGLVKKIVVDHYFVILNYFFLRFQKDGGGCDYLRY